MVGFISTWFMQRKLAGLDTRLHLLKVCFYYTTFQTVIDRKIAFYLLNGGVVLV